jgi:hypothetical protein
VAAHINGKVRKMAVQRVVVWGKPYEISVFSKSKTVWIATGDYMGSTLQVQSTSAAAAAKRWQEAASYKGNG